MWYPCALVVFLICFCGLFSDAVSVQAMYRRKVGQLMTDKFRRILREVFEGQLLKLAGKGDFEKP
jgi:uncharacterized membrane protein